jgi:hypothetical protein
MDLKPAFSYEASAEIYASSGYGARKRPVSYRRFSSSAEAIRFVVEELPQMLQRGTVMEIGDDRYEFAAIYRLYESDAYPLARNAEDNGGPAR